MARSIRDLLPPLYGEERASRRRGGSCLEAGTPMEGVRMEKPII